MARPRKPFQHVRPISLADLLGAGRVRKPSRALTELARSLETQGLLRPVLVTEGARKGTWRVVSGKRRVQAARLLGWSQVSCAPLGREFRAEMAVIERLQRDVYEPFELADTLRRLQDGRGWTQTQLGLVVGRSRDFIANILAVHDILPAARRFLRGQRRGRALTARHLRFVAREAPGRQMAAARRIVTRGLSTKSLERERHRHLVEHPGLELVKVRPARPGGGATAPRSAADWRRYARQLATDLRRIERRVRVERKRAEERVLQARRRRARMQQEALRKRRLLERELRRAQRALARLAGGARAAATAGREGAGGS